MLLSGWTIPIFVVTMCDNKAFDGDTDLPCNGKGSPLNESETSLQLNVLNDSGSTTPTLTVVMETDKTEKSRSENKTLCSTMCFISII